MRGTGAVLRPVLAAVSTGLLLIVPAGHAQQAPRAALYLSVEARGDDPVQARLTCAPNGGDHPRATMACDALRNVYGRPGELPSTGESCTMEYWPTVGEITGHWLGGPVRFRHTYGNPCLAARDSDGVLALSPRPSVHT